MKVYVIDGNRNQADIPRAVVSVVSFAPLPGSNVST
jgi:hypothetical protein